jgi:REP element-mobilizing transposase RayT
MTFWHLTLAADGRQALFPGETARRAAVRALARLAGGELVLFSVVDDHVHLVVTAEGPRVGRLARALLLGLRPLAAAPLDPARARPVETRSHLESLVRYVLGQTAHHGLAEQPALWTGSCFQDLVGARWLPELRLRLAEALPRLPRAALLEAVGVREGHVAPARDDALRAGGVGRLVAAVAAAAALPPDLGGRPAGVVTARRAAARLAQAGGLATADLAWALGVRPQAVRRLRTAPAPDALLRAARVRHALVERLAEAASPARAR